jgi:pSer/pThr/pTyr-binding forkhead associated (FHA) protein
VESGPDAGLRFRAVAGRVGFWGRALDNDIVVSDRGTSRRHARIEYRDGTFLLTDLGSANGTFVNGQRVVETHLQHGDKVKVGQNEAVVVIG